MAAGYGSPTVLAMEGEITIENLLMHTGRHYLGITSQQLRGKRSFTADTCSASWMRELRSVMTSYDG